MKKYIDKSVVVAEIEKRIKEHHSGYLVCLKDILSFLDTLEVKEVNDDKWIIKATEWLSANLHRYDESIGLGVEEFVEKFKKTMEE